LIDFPLHAEGPRYSTILGKRILTTRETEVLYHVARGETDRQIADNLFLSRRTVSNHVSNILDKLAVTNRREAVKTAFRIGLI
jgi:DNA-binding NarL/FixJ family response regulator